MLRGGYADKAAGQGLTPYCLAMSMRQVCAFKQRKLAALLISTDRAGFATVCW